MKKLVLAVFACIILFSSTSCSPEKAALSSPDKTDGLIWNKKNFSKTNKKLEEDSTVKVSMQGFCTRTPYYKAKDSQKYSVYMYYNKENRCSIDIAWDFGAFRNIFFYQNEEKVMIAKGAQTFDRSGQLVAEARLTRFLELDQKPKRFEIEEFHYGPKGNLVFVCKSQFDDLGMKIGQTEEEGKKENEYYFMWAVGF